jgi:hypothetical protein
LISKELKKIDPFFSEGKVFGKASLIYSYFMLSISILILPIFKSYSVTSKVAIAEVNQSKMVKYFGF